VSDHVYDPNAVSEQPGALAILKVLVTLDPSIQLGAAAPQEAPVTTTTAPTPVTTMPQIDLGALIGALLPHITAPGAPAAAPATTATTTVTAAVAPHAPTPVTTMPQIDLGALIGALLPHITAPGAPATAPTTTATAVTPQISLASIVAHLDLLMPVVKIVMGFIPEAAPFIPLLTVAQTLAHAAADAQTALQTNPAALGTVLSGALTNIAPLLQQVKGAMPQLASVADAVQKAAHTPAIAPATK
jgi:hypothetical protein